MNIEKMRKEFEAWGMSNGYEVFHKSMDGMTYIGGATAIAWEAWQASRESMVIELPPEFDVGVANPHMVMSSADVHDGIHAAGVKTK